MESNRLREQLLNAVGQALIATDLDGRITYWNQAAERLYGWAADEVLGRNILDVTPTKISREQATEIMEFLRAGKSWTGEFIVSHRDGTSFPVEVTDTPIMDDNGAMIGMIGLSTDITERRWAEAVLQENETRLRSVVESLPTALVMVDESGTITLVNKQVERWFGYNREELIGQPVDRLVPEPVRDQHQAERDDYLRAPTARKMGVGRDLYARRKDGSTFPVEIGLTPIEMVDGSRILATIVDITERKQAEEELRESESRYRLAIEAGRMGTWEWDVQAGKLHWSDYMRELFGVEPGQFDGRLETVRAWIHPEDRPLARSELQRVLAGGGEYHLEFRVLRPDGTIRWLNSHGRVRYDEEGKPQHVAGIVMDITDDKVAETQVRWLNKELEARVQERTAQLVAANQELEAFSYSVSHDLRAPLRTIDGFSRILLDTFADELDTKAQHYLQRIRQNTLHLGQLVDDLLQFSRLNRQSLRKREVEPRPLVEEVLGDLASMQEGRDVQVEIEPLPPCEADPTLLQQVYVNLLGNALKYTRSCKTAHIKVGARQSNEREVPIYYVADNGVGFDMKYAHKLFGVFQRLHRAEDFEGTGVGLALVQRIIHRHGGEVWAEAAPNQGATFYFTLTQGYSHEG